MSDFTIAIATTTAEIERCWPVMRELRPELDPDAFVPQVQRLQGQGYTLAYLTVAAEVRAIAGFRCGESLSWGRFLYVDDLVTQGGDRNRGYGQHLLTWLREQAQQRGCQHIQRAAAHRFYQRHGFAIAGYHFRQSLGTNDPKPEPCQG